MDGMLTEIQFWSMIGEAERRTIICSPENESRIKSWISARGLDHQYPVKVSRWMEDNQIILMDENVIQASLNQSLLDTTRTRFWEP